MKYKIYLFGDIAIGKIIIKSVNIPIYDKTRAINELLRLKERDLIWNYKTIDLHSAFYWVQSNHTVGEDFWYKVAEMLYDKEKGI